MSETLLSKEICEFLDEHLNGRSWQRITIWESKGKGVGLYRDGGQYFLVWNGEREQVAPGKINSLIEKMHEMTENDIIDWLRVRRDNGQLVVKGPREKRLYERNHRPKSKKWEKRVQ